MAVKIFSAAIVGFGGRIIEIEVEATHGLRSFDIVGLPDKSVQESKDRTSAAIKSSGFSPASAQAKKVLVNLAPADLKKEGSFYDLPIALGYLLKTEQIKFDPKGKIFIGELSLNGELKPARGVLALCLAIRENPEIKDIIVPMANAEECALAFLDFKQPINIIPAESLKQVINWLLGKEKIESYQKDKQEFLKNVADKECVDIGWIKGQETAKRALEICAAGGHNLLMVGPPGGGKSLLAKALPSIMPPLAISEMVEVTKIYSLAGLLTSEKPFMASRPFRSPHHTASPSAIVGGTGTSNPGEITLAHRGILFLDEFPEFHRDVLESLRQPMEDGTITVSRAKQRSTFPCRFMLVAAANPTPGGYFEDEGGPGYTSGQLAKYKRKLSGPIVDRIDLYVELPQVKYDSLIDQKREAQSQKIKSRVSQARAIQEARFAGQGILLNSEMQVPQIEKYCALNEASHNLARRFVDSGALSARGYHRVLKVARTIADLAGEENIKQEHLSEALMFRQKNN